MREYSYHDRPLGRTNRVIIAGVVILLVILAVMIFRMAGVQQTRTAQLMTVQVELADARIQG